MVVKGTTSSSASSDFFTSSSEIISYSLVNNSGGALIATVGILEGSTVANIYSGSLGANESYQYVGEAIIIPTGTRILVTAGGASIDFYFSIK
jgi:hypothetical protein